MEQWRDVIEAKEYYEVSNKGRVRNKLTNALLRQRKQRTGYLSVELAYGVNKHRLVHRLVAEAFIENPCMLPCVNHKDENKENNFVENLEWCTYQYNVRYGKGALVRNHGVIQYDIAGNALRIWESEKQAAEFLGIKYQGISKCCRGRGKTCGGYMWSYANLGRIKKYIVD